MLTMLNQAAYAYGAVVLAIVLTIVWANWHNIAFSVMNLFYGIDRFVNPHEAIVPKFVPGMKEFTLRVDVTAQDIASGKQADCERCPIALALVRAAEGFGFELYERYSQMWKQPIKHVSVGTAGAHMISKKEHYYVASFPPQARAFVADFDKGLETSPFSFLLNFRLS